MVPHMEFLFTLWYPKGSKKNWPKCHSGQSVSGQSVTLAKESLWPKCHSGQSVTLAKVSLAKVSLWPKCLWPKCLWPNGHSGQSVILAKVSRPKCLWPKCHSGQSVIQPEKKIDIIFYQICYQILTTTWIGQEEAYLNHFMCIGG